MRKQSLRLAANKYLQLDKSGNQDNKKRRRQVIHNLIDDLFLIGDVPCNWNALTTEHLKQLVSAWHKRKRQPATMMKHMTIIRKFLAFISHPLAKIANKTLNIKCKIKVTVRPSHLPFQSTL